MCIRDSDLSIVRYISDRIGVIYKGKIVEIASSEELFDYPLQDVYKRQDQDHIAYCGPYLCTNVTDKNSINYIANESYWNAENVSFG